ncbi:hypothetical protein BD410DRAFT_810835, partial [Rickenella mellea]
YPVIVVADSREISSFQYKQFQRLRLWLYDFAIQVQLDRHVAVQKHAYDCTYHMLHNMRQICDNYREILHLLPWEFEADTMCLGNLMDEDHQRIWQPGSVLLRKLALQRQVKTYREIDAKNKRKDASDDEPSAPTKKKQRPSDDSDDCEEPSENFKRKRKSGYSEDSESDARPHAKKKATRERPKRGEQVARSEEKGKRSKGKQKAASPSDVEKGDTEEGEEDGAEDAGDSEGED